MPPTRFGRSPKNSHQILFVGTDRARGALGLANLKEVERVGSRLFFFACDHIAATGSRALYSIGLTGIAWDGAAPTQHIAGLAEGEPGDGSDELDLDEGTGVLYGSNIVNGENIAFVVGAGAEVTSPRSTHVVDGPDMIALITPTGVTVPLYDGIRADGLGHLVLTGQAGIITGVDIMGAWPAGPIRGTSTPCSSTRISSSMAWHRSLPSPRPSPSSPWRCAAASALPRAVARTRRTNVCAPAANAAEPQRKSDQ